MKRILSIILILYSFCINAQLCFRAPISHPTVGKWSTVTGDFNNDNFQDIASYTNNNSITVLLGNGTGSLTVASVFTVNAANSSHSFNELVARDFNADGDLDLAVIHAGSTSVTMFTGLGTGSFMANGATNTVGSQPVGISSADFNNDGYIDIAVANAGSKNISILLGLGFGYFNPAVNFAVLTGGTPRSITVGDYNSDGKKDLAVGIQTTTSTNKIAIYIGDGLGNFSAGANYSVALTFPNSLETRDFNADGKLDLVCNKSSNSFIGVFLGLGNGGFSSEVTYNSLVGQSTNILCGDYNSDGIIDIAAGSYTSNEISVLLGNGSGGFGTALKYPTGTKPVSASSADFNNDGKLDISVGLDIAGGINVLLNGQLNVSVTGSLSICSGNSSTLTANGATSYTWSPNAGGVTTSTVLISPLSTAIYTIIAKNGSCVQATKIVTVNVTNTPTVSITSSAFNGCRGSSITFSASGSSSYTWSANASNSNSPIVTVFPTSSTRYDVIGANGQCSLTKHEYVTVSSDLLLRSYSNFNLSNGGGKMISKDFNNDGKLDILQTDEVLFGDGRGNFNFGVSIPFNGGGYGITASDFNGDGYLDVALAAGNSNVKVSLSNSNGTYTNFITLIAGTLPTIIGSADFNGDSKMDLAVGSNNSNNISIFIGDGIGGFSAPINYNVPSIVTNGSICIEDFNNDGKKDIVTSGQILLGTGLGSFLPSQIIGASGAMFSDDINNDGNKDIICAQGNQISISLGNGDGTFYSGQQYGTGISGMGVTDIICADLNNDGFKDFAVTDINTNNVYVTLGNGVGGVSGQSYPLFPTSGYVGLTCGDFTGNGKIDLAAGSYASAGFSVLLNGLDVYSEDFTLCYGGFLTHNGTYGGGFSNVSLFNPFGGLPINVAPPTPVTFSVVATYGSCNYKDVKNFTLPVNPSPTVSLVPTNTLICLSQPFLSQNQYQTQSTLTASGALNYQFDSGTSSTTNTFVITNDPNQSFIYNATTANDQLFSVVGTNSNGCSNADTIYLKIVPAFTIAVTSTTSCSSANCTLTAFSPSAVSYTWNTGQQGTPIVVQPQEPSPGVPQTFIPRGIDMYGCGSDLNSPGSVVQLFPNQLTNFAYTTNSLSVTFSMTNPNYCNGQGFLWDFGNGMQNTLSSNPSITYNQPGLYTTCLKCGNNVPQECIACTTFSLPSSTNSGTDVSVFEYQNSTLGIKYYPNPNTGNFTIETETEKLINIINILSETILTQQLQKGKNEIDFSNYANGVYFIKAGNSTFKIIKQ